MGLTESKKLPAEEESEIAHIHHERFANRVILKSDKEEDVIMIKVALPSEKEYNAWKEELLKLGEQDTLLLPKRHSFQREGFCGSTGYVEVLSQLSSSSTRTIRSSSAMRSTIENASAPNTSNKTNSGTSDTRCSRPRRTSTGGARSWETSGP